MARRTVALAVIGLAVVVSLAGCAAIPDAVTTPDPVSDTDTPAGTTTPTETPAETTTPTGTPAETATPTETPTDDDTDAGTETPDGELEIHFINVGQADATLLIGPTGETMLIDSGDWRDDGATVIDYLETHDVDRIDYLVSTHGHADHIGGHAAVIEHYETERDGIGAVYDNGVPHTSQTYGNYLDAVEEHDVTLYEVREGDSIPFEEVDVTVVNPAVDTDADDLHGDSVSVHLQFGATSVLFTGDAEEAAEARMTDEHGDDLDADLYHAGHHGSSTSSTPTFLDAVDPGIALVSSSYDSQYGHPHEEVLDRFDERGIDTYWTATHGTTVATSDGETLTLATQHDATVDPSELRGDAEATADPTDGVEERRTYDGGGDRNTSLVSPPRAPSFPTAVGTAASPVSDVAAASPGSGVTAAPVMDRATVVAPSGGAA